MRIPEPGQSDEESPKTRRKSPKAAPLGDQDLNAPAVAPVIAMKPQLAPAVDETVMEPAEEEAAAPASRAVDVQCVEGRLQTDRPPTTGRTPNSHHTPAHRHRHHRYHHCSCLE